MSFGGALQAVRAFGERLLEADAAGAAELHEWLLLVLGCRRRGNPTKSPRPRGQGVRGAE